MSAVSAQSNVDLTASADCDLGSVLAGQSVSCALDVVAADPTLSGEGATSTIVATFNLIDSTGDSSYCESPLVTYTYLNNDFASGHEYLDVFEGASTSGTTISRCSSGQDGACDTKTCFSDQALTNDYSESSSIAITVFASAGVDGIHWDGVTEVCTGGNQVDSTLTLTCTRALHCADEDCDDGDVCNGVEYCLDGQCASGDALECPFDFVCSTERQRCVRDCETFAIDGYLRDCSEEYDYIKTDIAGVIDQASDNLESIVSLQTQVANNTEDLATVISNVDEVNAVIGGERASWGDSEAILDQLTTLNDRMNDVDSLLTRMDAVEARLDTIEERLFGYAPQTAEGENAENSFTSPDELAGSSTPLITVNGYQMNWVGVAVAATVLLLAINVVLLVNNFCCGKGGKSRKQYRVVYQDSSDEQFERARLNK